MTPLRAFHGDPALKQALLRELRKHAQADALIKGSYGDAGLSLTEGFKGCAVGCALHSLNTITGDTLDVGRHERFPKELGIPLELAYHIDTVFENLPARERQAWPRRVIAAIRPGADLSEVISALLQWMILDPQDGFISRVQTDAHRDILTRFARLVAQDWTGTHISAAQWVAIDRELWTLPAWARAWAWAWAGAGARAGAGSRAWAWAWAWAWARAGARAWAGAWADSYSRLSQQTLRLIREAPVR